jgi:hypothetical protein
MFAFVNVLTREGAVRCVFVGKFDKTYPGVLSLGTLHCQPGIMWVNLFIQLK